MNNWTHLSATAKRHLRAICSDNVTRTNIIGLRKIFNHHARLSAGLDGNRCNVTAEEARKLEAALYERQPLVTGALHDSGLAILRSRRYAKRLASYADQIAQIYGFRLIGFYWIDPLHCIPQYRAMCRNGRHFSFIVQPWQSGGNGPEILI